jgi:hypothetical protein
MPTYVHLNDTGLDDLHADAGAALAVVTTTYDEHRTARSKLDDKKNRDVRHLSAAERFQDGQKLQTEAIAKAMRAAGDLGAKQASLARIAENLNLDNLMESASFLPKIVGGGADALVHDTRLLADEAARTRYLRRVDRLDPEGLVVEVQRAVEDAGDDPAASDGLARLHALDEHSRGMAAGSERTRVRAALSSAVSKVEDRWASRRERIERLTEVAQRLDQVADTVYALRYGTEPARLKAAKFVGAKFRKTG